ncbi:hypothetical protein HK098_002586 [Nowakowskiella sp. JEL0407]|nr:hypothetical protein HK098_002586 [Nowakowskiella sp. JEL0407]
MEKCERLPVDITGATNPPYNRTSIFTPEDANTNTILDTMISRHVQDLLALSQVLSRDEFPKKARNKTSYPKHLFNLHEPLQEEIARKEKLYFERMERMGIDRNDTEKHTEFYDEIRKYIGVRMRLNSFVDGEDEEEMVDDNVKLAQISALRTRQKVEFLETMAEKTKQLHNMYSVLLPKFWSGKFNCGGPKTGKYPIIVYDNPENASHPEYITYCQSLHEWGDGSIDDGDILKLRVNVEADRYPKFLVASGDHSVEGMKKFRSLLQHCHDNDKAVRVRFRYTKNPHTVIDLCLIPVSRLHSQPSKQLYLLRYKPHGMFHLFVGIFIPSTTYLRQLYQLPIKEREEYYKKKQANQEIEEEVRKRVERWDKESVWKLKDKTMSYKEYVNTWKVDFPDLESKPGKAVTVQDNTGDVHVGSPKKAEDANLLLESLYKDPKFQQYVSKSQ